VLAGVGDALGVGVGVGVGVLIGVTALTVLTEPEKDNASAPPKVRVAAPILRALINFISR
jgi:hypothetical protein